MLNSSRMVTFSCLLFWSKYIFISLSFLTLPFTVRITAYLYRMT